MRFDFRLTALAFFLSAGLGQAGIASDEWMKCPIGLERFKITTTLSCSTQGTTMALQPVTSCDFITRLPVCPKNGLPVYKSFEKPELKELRAYIKTDAYKARLGQSPFLRAHALAAHLEGAHGPSALGLLRAGLWYDREAMMKDPQVIDLLIAEVKSAAPKISKEDKAYLVAATAYELALAGKTKTARKWLDAARKAKIEDEFLAAYIKAVLSCLGRMSDDACQPYAEFRP